MRSDKYREMEDENDRKSEKHHNMIMSIHAKGGYKKIMEDASDIVLRHLPEAEKMPLMDTERIVAVRMALQAGCGDVAAARLLDAIETCEGAQWSRGWNAAPKDEQVYYSGHGGVPERSWEKDVVRFSDDAMAELNEARACLLSIVAPDYRYETDTSEYGSLYSKRYITRNAASQLAEWYMVARKDAPLVILPKLDLFWYGPFYSALEEVAQRRDRARKAVEKAIEDAKDELFREACVARQGKNPEIKPEETLLDLFLKSVNVKVKTADDLMDDYAAAVRNLDKAQEALDEVSFGV